MKLIIALTLATTIGGFVVSNLLGTFANIVTALQHTVQ